MIVVEEFTVGPFAQHPLVVFDEKSKDAFLVDMGFDTGEIDAFIQQNNLNLIAIYNTHAHIDHVGATVRFQKKYDIPFYIGEGESIVLDYAPISATQYQFPFDGKPKVFGELKDGEQFLLGDYSFSVITTPGHTPGGVCYYCQQAKIVLVGDTLFAGSIGRTDLPGGDYATILNSLEKLKQLPADTKVYCGHGEQTTIGHEIATNPFLQK